MNVSSSRLLGEASDTYQFSIFPAATAATPPAFIRLQRAFVFLHRGLAERMSKWLGTDITGTFAAPESLTRYEQQKKKKSLLACLTCAGRLDADGLEAAVESRGIDDVRVEVAMVLAVHEERHDDGDD